MVLSTGFALFRGRKIVKERNKPAIFTILGVLRKKTPSWDGATRRSHPRAAPAQWTELEPDTDFSKKKLAVDNTRPSLGAPLRGQAHPGLAGVLQRKGLEGGANPTDLLLEFAAQTPRLVYAEPPTSLSFLRLATKNAPKFLENIRNVKLRSSALGACANFHRMLW
jgi:hypothetical protein